MLSAKFNDGMVAPAAALTLAIPIVSLVTAGIFGLWKRQMLRDALPPAQQPPFSPTHRPNQ